MTRTISAPVLAALTASPRKGAECLVLEARDGTRVGFTTWNRALSLDLGLGDGAETMSPGMTLSEVTLSVGFDASNFEVSGPLAGDLARAKVLGGKWRKARAWLVRVSPGTSGYAPLLAGRVAEARVEGRRWVFEVRNAADAFNQSIGRVLSPLCSAAFGDAQCTVAKTAVPCTVTAVADDFRFTVNLVGAYADDYFARGTVGFLTGELGGTDEVTVWGFDGATGAVELLEPMVAAPEIGDTLNLFRGCSKLLKSTDASLPTCLTYGNVVNFRGHPEVPSSRVYQRVSAPGASYA